MYKGLELMGSNSTVLFSIIGLLIISIIINLYLFSKIKSSKPAGIKKLDEQLKVIYAHLNQQSSISQNYLTKNDFNDFQKKLIQVRTAYLMIEYHALARLNNNEQLFKFLIARLSKFCELIARLQSGITLSRVSEKIDEIKSIISSSDINDKDVIYSCLDRFYATCKLNPDARTLRDHNTKLDKILRSLGSSNLKNVEEAVSDVNKLESSASPAFSIAKRSQNTSALAVLSNNGAKSETIKNYKSQDKQFKTGVGRYESAIAEAKIGLQQVSASTDANDVDKDNSISDITEQIIEKNEREISRLRNIIKNQKSAILDLESETNHQGGGEVHPATDILNRQIQEYETCITLLETELENYKGASSKTTDLNTDIFEGATTHNRAAISEEEADQLKVQIEQMEKEASDSKDRLAFFNVLAEFFIDAANADSYEDLSLLIHDTYDKLELTQHVIIIAPNRKINLASPNKKANPMQLKLIANFAFGEQQVSDDRKTLFFKQHHFGGTYSKQSNEPFNQEDLKNLSNLNKVIDRSLDLLRATSKNKVRSQGIGDCSNGLKRVAADVQSELESLNTRTSGIIRDSFGQMQDVARSAGLNATQIARLQRIENEAIDELQADEYLQLKIKKGFLTALSQLDKL